MSEKLSERKRAIFDAKRVRMHLQSAVAHLNFCSTSYLIPENQKKNMLTAIIDCEVIDEILDTKIIQLECINDLECLIDKGKTDV